MKKLFLLILAGGIMITACKKEEVKLRCLGNGILLNGNVGDLYENPITGDKVFYISAFTKTNGRPRLEDLKYNYVENGGFFRCEEPGDECLVDYDEGIVYVRKGADTRK